ncbi:hypothetical protein EQG63_04875 [Flavobacterium amnicola]|uniref:DUF4412 domain-containing protein n=1 Tax=Flavobacterium amnicola TaxID=2506422 RepID=A0A4Q1K726_9FLAO|nr:DUF4412 domain-containing protein [Flavobacterium amnicola]RXR21275.1 hypothetical protein EQG63_04875 [Flavobacterium amnicola]
MKAKTYFIYFGLIVSLTGVVSAQKPKMNMEDLMNLSKNKVDASKIPDKYTFSWKYAMQITSDKGKEIVFDYFLEPNATYYGANMNKAGASAMFMIMDTKNNISISTFGKDGKKMAMVSKVPDYSKMVDDKTKKVKYKAIPSKKILGFNCKGMQATNDEMEMVLYYTTEAKVSFTNVFKMNQNGGMPDVFKDLVKPNEKPLLMEMNYKDLKNKSKTTTMKCIELNKESYTFNKSDYKFM